MKQPDSRKIRQRALRTAALAGMMIVGALHGPAICAEKTESASPPGFDYWQPDWMVRELWGPGRLPKGMMVRLLRHTIFIHSGVPKEYEAARSTVTPGPETTAAGGKLYAEHCASCHAINGMGNGDAGKALTPSPALLAYMIRRPISVDEYLLWTISEGGKQFDTDMPAFKDKLEREDIWRIVAYMRAGFPATIPTPSANPNGN